MYPIMLQDILKPSQTNGLSTYVNEKVLYSLLYEPLETDNTILSVLTKIIKV